MTTWVLLRGLGREAGHWGGFADVLRNALGEGARVAAVDLPGNGALHALQSPARVQGMAAALDEQLARLPPPYMVVAMSLGAMVALEWSATAQDAAGCVLINTSLRGHSPFWRRLRPRNYMLLLRIASGAMTVREREEHILAMTSGAPRRHAGIAAQWAALARQRPVDRANLLRQLSAAARYAAPARPPQVPLLLLASESDGLVSPQCSRSTAARWSLPLCMHPDAGHDLPLDDPRWVATQVAQWRAGLLTLSNP